LASRNGLFIFVMVLGLERELKIGVELHPTLDLALQEAVTEINFRQECVAFLHLDFTLPYVIFQG
jgi:hypothetical protein